MNRGGRMVTRSLVGSLILLVGLSGAAVVASAQGIDAPTPTGRDLPPTDRLGILAVSLGLTKEQKAAVKTRLDAAHKGAAPIRTRLLSTRTAIVDAVQGSKPQADIDAAVATHASEITAMTQLEVKVLAEVLAMLTPDQQATVRSTGIRTPFFVFRGIFLEERRWNVTPATSGY